MRMAERPGGIDRVDRHIDARILPRRHRRLDRGGDFPKLLLLLLRRERADIIIEHFLRRNHALHYLAREHPALHLAVRHPRIVLEPDRMARAAPGQSERRRMLPRHRDLEAGAGWPFDILILLQIIPFCLQNGKDGLCGGIGRKTFPQHENIERIEPRCLQTNIRRDLASRVHLRNAWREQQARGGEFRAKLLLRHQHPILLAGGIQIVTSGRQARLDHGGAKFDERPNGVANHARALEERGQRLDRMLDTHHLVIGRLDAG